MSKHTPGPWRWVEDEHYPETALLSDSETVMRVYESHGGGAMPDDADARLIAAAPDLLVALELAEQNLQTEFGPYEEQDRVREIVKAAIAKARGE